MKGLVKSAKISKVCLVVALVTIAYSGRIIAQEKESAKTHTMHMQHDDKQKSSSQHDHMKMGSMDMGSKKDAQANTSASVKEETIVHKGVIDLKAIDKNKDGKVFQDQMDWNVISDNPGKCPLCKMTLEEVTVKKAKENLKSNGFKVKE